MDISQKPAISQLIGLNRYLRILRYFGLTFGGCALPLEVKISKCKKILLITYEIVIIVIMNIYMGLQYQDSLNVFTQGSQNKGLVLRVVTMSMAAYGVLMGYVRYFAFMRGSKLISQIITFVKSAPVASDN